jgi:hypothetical protein
VNKLKRTAFHRVRKNRIAFRPVFDIREEGVRLVVENYVEKEPDGRGKMTANGQDFLWIKDKEEVGRAALADVNSEKHKVKILPILWDDLLPEEEEGDEEGDVTNAGLLFNLSDLGIVVDELPKE